MKKVMVAVLAGVCLFSAMGVSSVAMAQGATETKKSVKAPAAKKSVKSSKHKASRRHAPMKKAALPAAAMIPEGAEKWSCNEGNAVYISGDMSRDQILSVFWDGRTYKLPREVTTTGADRFYDPASGLDLVVIPTKAMLFDDRGDRTRLADECKTMAMATQGVLAPTQSNELRK